MPHAVNADAPALSVAMSVYNAEAYLALAIESILAQSMPAFEFLILNDGSNDRSKEIIDGYAARDSRIRAIHRENKGLIVSLNQLLEEARAPLIARMDADDIALPDRFAKQLTFMAAHPDYGVVGTWTRDIDANGESFPLGGADHPTSHEDFIAHIEQGPLICHPSVIMRADVVRAVGGYHAAFKHCEDYDLWLRLSSVTKICSIPERLVLYRHTDGQVSNKHIVQQQIGVAASRLAWRERMAGRPDPTEHLDALPPMEEYDALFGRMGAYEEALSLTVGAILYSHVALTSEGFDLVLRHIRENRAEERVPGIPRTVARLVRFGEPVRALKLAGSLARAHMAA